MDQDGAPIVPLVSLEGIHYNSVTDVMPMSFSMTGFGQSTRKFGGFTLRFELKCVNHRYCEVLFRMPREWARHEDGLRKLVQREIARGRVDVSIAADADEQSAGPVLNEPLVRAYLAAAERLRSGFGLPGDLTPGELLRLPGVMEGQDRSSVLQGEAFETVLRDGLEESLRELVAMRAREGRFLSEEMLRRLEVLERHLDELAALAPSVPEEYRDRLRNRLQELSEGVFPFDEQRFNMEVALFADRSSIDEELVRLRSHTGQFRDLLEGGGPSGRKLDFLVQEMNREANTIGSKSSRLEITNRVLDIKNELEKIREQAANLE